MTCFVFLTIRSYANLVQNLIYENLLQAYGLASEYTDIFTQFK